MPLDIRSVFDWGSRDSGHGPAPAGGPDLSGGAAAGMGDAAELCGDGGRDEPARGRYRTGLAAGAWLRPAPAGEPSLSGGTAVGTGDAAAPSGGGRRDEAALEGYRTGLVATARVLPAHRATPTAADRMNREQCR